MYTSTHIHANPYTHTHTRTHTHTHPIYIHIHTHIDLNITAVVVIPPENPDNLQFLISITGILLLKNHKKKMGVIQITVYHCVSLCITVYHCVPLLSENPDNRPYDHHQFVFFGTIRPSHHQVLVSSTP